MTRHTEFCNGGADSEGVCHVCAVMRTAQVVTSAHELSAVAPASPPTAGDVVVLIADPADDDAAGTVGAEVDVAVVAVESIVAIVATGLFEATVAGQRLEKDKGGFGGGFFSLSFPSPRPLAWHLFLLEQTNSGGPRDLGQSRNGLKQTGHFVGYAGTESTVVHVGVDCTLTKVVTLFLTWQLVEKCLVDLCTF